MRQSTPECGHRAGDGGDKRRNGSKIRLFIVTLGHRRPLHGAAAAAQGRKRIFATSP
jgi:hypothetical protein